MVRLIPALLALVVAAPAQADCRQALALGLDVSGSVDGAEYRLQLDGLAAALENTTVRAAFLAQPADPVSLLVYEWSSSEHHRLVLDWTDITDATALNDVAARLRGFQRVRSAPSTAIGAALVAGLSHLHTRQDCRSQTLDISGDGISNTGPHPRSIRPMALAAGVTVNGLVIEPDIPLTDPRELQPGELAEYYAAYVIAGEGSFVETARGFADYEAAMTRKLLRELQGLQLSSLTPGTFSLQ